MLFRTMAEPLVKYLRLPVWAAVLIAFTLTLVVLTLSGWWMAPSISQQFDEMSVRLPEAIACGRACTPPHHVTTPLFPDVFSTRILCRVLTQYRSEFASMAQNKKLQASSLCTA